MSRQSDSAILQDIKEAVDRVLSYTKGVEYRSFLEDPKTQDAVIRNIEILGEATKLLSDKTKGMHPEIPWKSIAGARDKLIHDYFGVNIDIVWEIASNDIPNLCSQLSNL